jgi:hypothetical protein
LPQLILHLAKQGQASQPLLQLLFEHSLPQSILHSMLQPPSHFSPQVPLHTERQLELQLLPQLLAQTTAAQPCAQSFPQFEVQEL